MSDQPESAEVKKISCDICLREVPLSEANIAEAEDYVAHFCGIECYTEWKQLGEKTKQPKSE